MNRTWLVLDCNYLAHRAKHVLGELSYEGNATGVVYGFLKDIEYLQKQFQTRYTIFCWDYGFGKRKVMSKSYKQNRHRDDMTEEELKFEKEFRKQMDLLRTKYLRKIGYRNIFYQEGYEADDVIASICKNLPKGDDAVIVSADHDLYQLLADNIIIYHPQTKKIVSLQTFSTEYGILPEDWIEVKALAGCSSDNIKGIEGVGEKTAIKFIKMQLNEKTKTYQKILKESKKTFDRNIPLVSLPLKGTEVFRLKKDKLTKAGWKKVTTSLGIRSIKTIATR